MLIAWGGVWGCPLISLWLCALEIASPLLGAGKPSIALFPDREHFIFSPGFDWGQSFCRDRPGYPASHASADSFLSACQSDRDQPRPGTPGHCLPRMPSRQSSDNTGNIEAGHWWASGHGKGWQPRLPPSFQKAPCYMFLCPREGFSCSLYSYRN